MVYNEEQLNAIESCINFIKQGNSSEYFLIEGKAGTGKTTVIKEVIKKFKHKKIIAGALSHKAKYVIRESIESSREKIKIDYSSIAGMLSMQLDLETGTFKKIYTKGSNVNKLNNYDIVIIDEASMVNEEMIELLFKEKKKNAKLIFLGDIGQLPPIRTKSNPYYCEWNDIDLSKNSPIFNTKNKVKLLKRVRQGEESPILPFADFFWENTQNESPLKNPANIKYRNTIINDKGSIIFVNETKEIFKQILELYEKQIKNKNSNLVKFLTYKNNTRNSINKYIHEYFFGKNSNTFESGETIIFNDNFGDYENSSEYQIVKKYDPFIDKIDNIKLYSIDIVVDDRIEQLNLLHPDSYNDYEKIIKNKFNIAFKVKNFISENEKNSSKKELKELYDLYRKKLEDAWEAKKRFPNIDYAYAITIHKAQGSTYDIAIIHEQDIMSVKPTGNKEKSQSIYTALTRAKNISIIISNERLYNNTIDNINLVELNNNINNKRDDLRSITLQP